MSGLHDPCQNVLPRHSAIYLSPIFPQTQLMWSLIYGGFLDISPPATPKRVRYSSLCFLAISPSNPAFGICLVITCLYVDFFLYIKKESLRARLYVIVFVSW